MKILDYFQIGFFFLCIIVLTPIVGRYIAMIFQGKIPSWLEKLEHTLYRICGIDPSFEMTWKEYLKAIWVFNFIGFISLFLILLCQGFFPLNPQNFSSVPWPLALNITMSFITNTNWQSYTPETTLSYFSQMTGLAAQNFFSAATGMAVLFVLIRGITQNSSEKIGNFWIDITRTIIYLLLPFSIIFAIILVSQGVIQTFNPYVEIHTLEKGTQTIPLGPAASQVAIKQLGSNGGGFFNANSAHPFENPTPISNFVEMVAILLIPAASIYAYGILIGSRKQGWLIFFVMFFFFMAGIAIALYSETLNNPIFNEKHLMEGKETRFGFVNSILWSVTTTATSNGSVNASMTALSPFAGGVALLNMMLGEVIYGGVGVGLCGLLMFVILTVFLAGLMVGRTPEYLGKKIEKGEVQWVMIAVLFPSTIILLGSGIALLTPEGFRNPETLGPHGLTDILYAFSSTTGNNGSSFTSLNTNTNFFNIILAITMLLGRLAIVISSIVVAGKLTVKKKIPFSEATFETNSFLFAILLGSVILIVGALIFFPALALGPIVEQFLMHSGETF